MKIYDISMMIQEEMMVYKNKEEKRPRLSLDKKISIDGINESSITMNLHTGTHIDAPFHMCGKGSTAEQLDIAQLMTRCRVIDLLHVSGGIKKDDLITADIKKGDFILCKTANSFTEEFASDFIFLEKSGAEYLADQGIAGVGIDALGIERGQPEHQTHKVLMEKGIIIIQGLRLKDVMQGIYFMIALPLKIKNADGAPARVVLIQTQADEPEFLPESLGGYV